MRYVEARGGETREHAMFIRQCNRNCKSGPATHRTMPVPPPLPGQSRAQCTTETVVLHVTWHPAPSACCQNRETCPTRHSQGPREDRGSASSIHGFAT